MFRASLVLLFSSLLIARGLAQPAASPGPSPTLEQMAAQVPAVAQEAETKLKNGDAAGAVGLLQQIVGWCEQLSTTYPQEPVYTDNLFYYLGRLASAYAAADQLPEALNIQKPVASGYSDLAASRSSEEAKARAADAWAQLAWYQLLAGEKAEALESARQATSRAASPSAQAVLAHALLVNGRKEEAGQIYTAQRLAPLPDGRTFEQGVLEDFAELERAGATGDFARMRALYGARQPGSMGAVWGFVIIFGILALLIAVVVMIFMAEKKRTQKLEALAQRLGHAFRKKATPEDQKLVANTALGQSGHGRNVSNVIEALATTDGQISVFEYSYVSGHGKSRRTSQQTVANVRTPFLNLSAFSLQPESLLAKALKLVGFTDINFPEYPEFSKRYLLGGQDAAAVRKIFTPPIIQYCEQHPRLAVEGGGDRLLIYRQGVRVKPEAMEAFLLEARTLTGMFVEASRSS